MPAHPNAASTLQSVCGSLCVPFLTQQQARKEIPAAAMRLGPASGAGPLLLLYANTCSAEHNPACWCVHRLPTVACTAKGHATANTRQNRKYGQLVRPLHAVMGQPPVTATKRQWMCCAPKQQSERAQCANRDRVRGLLLMPRAAATPHPQTTHAGLPHQAGVRDNIGHRTAVFKGVVGPRENPGLALQRSINTCGAAVRVQTPHPTQE